MLKNTMRKAMSAMLGAVAAAMVFAVGCTSVDKKIYLRKLELEAQAKNQGLVNISTSEGPIKIEIQDSGKMAIECPNGTISILNWKPQEAPAEEAEPETK